MGMKEKNEKGSKRKNSKAVIAAISVCAVLLAAVIIFAAFFDGWVGKYKLNKLRSNITECRDVLITSPLYFDEYSSVAEAVLSEEEAEALVKAFTEATERMSYDGKVEGTVGYWDTQISFVTGDGRYTVYAREDGVYVTGKSFGYMLVPRKSCGEAYGEFYGMLCDILDNSKQ